MKTISTLAALGAALLGLFGPGCGGGGAAPPAEDPTAVIGRYERSTPQYWLRYRLTPTSGPAYTAWHQVTLGSPSGFTRRAWNSINTSWSESDYVLEAGGGLGLARSGAVSAGATSMTESFYSPALLVLPADLQPGAVTSRAWRPPGATTTLTREVTVGAVEAVTVPAGTFQALKVSLAGSSSDGATSYTSASWYAAGVGRVKIVTNNITPAASSTTYELEATGVGPLPVASPDGTYQVTAIRCAGAPAPSPLADLITAGATLGMRVAGAAETTTWGDGTCTISQPARNAYPVVGNLTTTPSGPFSCAPSKAACQALSGSTFGADVCGTSEAATPRHYSFTASSVPVGGALTLNRVGGTECADAGATDPVSYTLTRTE